MDEQKFKEIFQAAGGFSDAVIEYMWETRANDFPDKEDKLASLAKATTKQQKEHLEIIAKRWKERRDATS